MTTDYGRDMFVQGCGSEGTVDLIKKHFPQGFQLFPCCLCGDAQKALLSAIRAIIAEAPLFTPSMPRTGKPFSVAMTNCGPLGWLSDKQNGYRYEPVHPATGKPWPPIPPELLALWRELTKFPRAPQACLINYYTQKSRLGMHRDEDEADFSAPILSVSLGDTAIFRIGGLKRRDPAMSVALASGDALVMGGPSRLAYHGIARVMGGTSDLLEEGGRFNLTMRYVGE